MLYISMLNVTLKMQLAFIFEFWFFIVYKKFFSIKINVSIIFTWIQSKKQKVSHEW